MGAVGSTGRAAAARTARGGNGIFFASAACLGLALLLGGAGSNYPLLELIVEAAGLILLVVLGWRSEVRFGGWPGVIALLVLLLPVLHLIPLPPGTWTALPGRESAAQTLELIGQPLGWRRTRRTLRPCA